MGRHHTGGYHRPTHFSRRVSRFSAIFYSVVAFLFFFCFGLIGHTLRNHRLRLPFVIIVVLPFVRPFFYRAGRDSNTWVCVCVCIVLIMRRQSHARMIIPFLSGKNYLPTKYWSRKCIFLPSSSLFKVMSIRIATWWKESSKLSSELKMKEKNDSIFEDRTERGFWVGGWHKVLRYPSPTPLFFFFPPSGLSSVPRIPGNEEYARLNTGR